MIRLLRSRAAPLAIALLFLAHSLFYFIALGRDAVDDAYISFRYAQNAILGYGLVFNPGERVEGFTNFSWTALMIPLEGAGVDVGRASMLLGFLFALATMWLVYRFAKYLGLSNGVGLLAALLLAADGTFALWAVAGLESPLFAFLVFASAFLYIREQNSSGFPSSGFLLALASMTRPEGVMVFAITVAHQAVWRIWQERRLFSLTDIGRVFGFVALFVPYWLGRWAYYRSFLPNSFYAKVSASGPEAQLERGWRHLSQFVGVHAGWLITLPPLLALAGDASDIRKPHQDWTRARLFWSSYFAAIIILYAAYIVYVGGDWSVGRFFVPLLAPFYLLFATGLIDAANWLLSKRRALAPAQTRALGLAASAVLVAGLVWFSSWNGEYGIFIRGFDAGLATEARETMGKWLRANAAPGTWIAVDAAGQVPYFSGLPAIDMFGINDLHIGRLAVATLGQGTPGHEKFDLGYVVARAPTYVVIYGTLLDSVPEYERVSVAWTDHVEYTRFLTLYRHR